jgi:hypothetical protein
MPETAAQRLICGYPEEWKNFEERNRPWLERFPNLQLALSTAFIRSTTLTEHIDKFVFLYGRLCCEDFFEIGLCCGNGYGAAAEKLVRSLYERVVTLRYLHEHPEELDAFWNYHHVNTYKLMVAVEESMGTKTLSEEMRTKIKADYQSVKGDFMVTACERCGTKRLNHTWSKLDFVAMSKKTGTIGKLIVPGYYLPLRHAHATVGALLSRLEDNEIEGLSFIPTAQPEQADDALQSAANVIIDVLNVQDERFKIPGLKDQIQQVLDDLMEIYGGKKEGRTGVPR